VTRVLRNPRYKGEQTVRLIVRPAGTFEALVTALQANRPTRVIDETGTTRLARVMRVHLPNDLDKTLDALEVDAVLLD
jgi:hypothetical protein